METTKYCRIRKDLLEKELSVPIGEEHVCSTEKFPYRWAMEEWEKEEEKEFEVFYKGCWQGAESIDSDFEDLDLKARIARLPDVYCFTQNICALTEMKEMDHSSNPDLEIKLPMGERWDALAECAIEFSEKHMDTEWDGDWYEALEVFYGEKVRKLLFEI